MYGYNPQRNGESQQDDEEEVLWCLCSAEILGHQHILLWFCHLIPPVNTQNKFHFWDEYFFIYDVDLNVKMGIEICSSVKGLKVKWRIS